MFSGECNVILDEKNRITLPAHFRKDIDSASVVVSKGDDNCLWLYTSSKWEELVANPIRKYAVPFSKNGRRALRKYIAPSQTIEIDKAGRILISESLLEYAGISKECKVIGQLEYIEIWDKTRYMNYCDEDNEFNENEFDAAAEELTQMIKKERGIE